jgi:hypothetical protein
VVLRDRCKLNSHLYESHSEADIKSKYNKTLEKLICTRFKKRIHSAVFTQIYKGKWDEYLENLFPTHLRRQIS